MAERLSKTRNEGEATYDHVLKYTGLFGGVQGLTMLVSLVRNKISSELLGPSGLALVNLFNNAIKLTNQATNFGLSFSAVKSVAELSEETDSDRLSHVVGTVRALSLLTGLLGTLLLLILCNAVSVYTFNSTDYTWAFAALSPIVAMMSVQAGEIAILKGLKKLKDVALVSVFGVVLVLLICAPVYFIWRMQGIVGALLVSNAAVLFITLYYSNKIIPWRFSLNSQTTSSGIPMLKLGVGYLIAGVFGQGAEYVIRAMILDYGELADVGLYTSGYTLAVTYAGMVFVAIEADFFPRLSSANNDRTQRNSIINQQIEACVLLMAPILIFFVMTMPIIVPLLYSTEFAEAAPMAVCAAGYMFFKSLTLPLAYLPLAKGDSKMYMFTELIYDIFIAILIPQAFRVAGLEGAGWALTIAGAFDFVVIHSFYRKAYSFHLDLSKLKFYISQGLLFAFAVYFSLSVNPWLHWGLGFVAFAISFMITLRVLRRETTILKRLISKLKKR